MLDAKKPVKRTYKARWIASLLRSGLIPKLVVVETGYGDRVGAERGWIAFFKDLGCKLTNLTTGGEGIPGFQWLPEVKARISKKLRGQILSLETRLKMGAAHRGMKRSLEAIAKTAKANRGRKNSPETLAKMSVSQRKRTDARTQSPEAIEKSAAARRGRKNPPEVIARMSEARLRWWVAKKANAALRVMT